MARHRDEVGVWGKFQADFEEKKSCAGHEEPAEEVDEESGEKPA